MKQLLFAALAAAVLAAVTPALAQETTDWSVFEKQCNAHDGQNIPVAKRIRGCTALITAHMVAPIHMVPAYILRGRAYAEAGDDYRAEEDFDTALRIKPNEAWALIGRGDLFNKEGKYALALADFNKVLALQPGESDALAGRCLAQSHLQPGKPASAACDGLSATGD